MNVSYPANRIGFLLLGILLWIPIVLASPRISDGSRGIIAIHESGRGLDACTGLRERWSGFDLVPCFALDVAVVLCTLYGTYLIVSAVRAR
jgi:hypothetical protein